MRYALYGALRRSLTILALTLAVGCETPPPEGSPASCVESVALPGSLSTDILFVIDDSRSMAAAQAKVVEQLEAFIEALASDPLHDDFQIGVITTSVSMNVGGCDPETQPVLVDFPDHAGRLQLGKNLDGTVIDPNDPKIVRFDDPNLLPSARRLLGQGIMGSGQEMALEAMRLALTEPLVSTPLDAPDPGNGGFLRDGSRLLVIVVSDEDDCSDPTRTALALEPACGGSCESDEDCEGEGTYCLPGGDGGRLCHTNRCETPEGRSVLEPVDAYVDFLLSMDDGRGRRRETFLAVIGAVDPADPMTPKRCGDSEGVAVRYLEAVLAMGERGHIASICEDDFGEAIVEIAYLLDTPQELDLREEPLDPSLLQVRLRRHDGSEEICELDEGFVYLPPEGEVPARVRMLEQCRLHPGDEISIVLLCAS